MVAESAVSLYMHEIAMHIDNNNDSAGIPPGNSSRPGSSSGSLDMSVIEYTKDALSACFEAIDAIIGKFLSFEIATIHSLPVSYFVRVGYAVVVLIKMYFAASNNSSPFGGVINADAMKVEEKLRELGEKFKQASVDNKSRPSAKFLMVLNMLKSWFGRKRQGMAAAGDQAARAGPSSSIPAEEEQTDKRSKPNGSQERKDHTQVDNTPLQLLSELATGESRDQDNNWTQYPEATNGWEQPTSSYVTTNPTSQQLDPGHTGPNLDYTIGEGFEQAMGFTLSGLDTNMTDDDFFQMMSNGGFGFDGL